jgi:small subunit ribosomal protein S8
MSINDPLGDLLTRIRNAQMRNKSKVLSPSSKLRERVLEVLKSEGYIRGFTIVEREGHSEIEIELKYFDGEHQ